jgi:hypothetical protein
MWIVVTVPVIPPEGEKEGGDTMLRLPGCLVYALFPLALRQTLYWPATRLEWSATAAVPPPEATAAAV